MGTKGMTAIELLVTMILAAVLIGAAAPVLMTGVESARFNAAAGQVVGDMRLARSKAVSTGWQYRIRGRDQSSPSNPKNRYRIEGRRNSMIAWPSETDPPQQTADEYVGRWIEIAANYPGIWINNSSGSPKFFAGFDPSGRLCTPLSQCANGFSPLTITKVSTGQTRQVWVSLATGHVRVQ